MFQYSVIYFPHPVCVYHLGYVTVKSPDFAGKHFYQLFLSSLYLVYYMKTHTKLKALKYIRKFSLSC